MILQFLLGIHMFLQDTESVSSFDYLEKMGHKKVAILVSFWSIEGGFSFLPGLYCWHWIHILVQFIHKLLSVNFYW